MTVLQMETVTNAASPIGARVKNWNPKTMEINSQNRIMTSLWVLSV